MTRAARLGEPGPLLRIADLMYGGRAGAVFTGDAPRLATVCRDGPFPWQADTPLLRRPAALEAAVAGLSAAATAPFGMWVARGSYARLCRLWPSRAGGESAGDGSLPDVPVLALSGDVDTITPTSGAAAAVSRFPRGRLLVAPGIGHGVVVGDASGCVRRAVVSWLAGSARPGRCARRPPVLAPLGSLVLDGRSAQRAATPAQAMEVVRRTLREAEATWLLATGVGRTRVAGLRGGTLTARGGGFRLERYSLRRGVALSGDVDATGSRVRRSFSGRIVVESPAGSKETLELRPDGALSA